MPIFWASESDDGGRVVVKDYVSARKPVKDLLFQSGEEEWKAFYAARDRMEAYGGINFRHASLFETLRGTPIYEVLMVPTPENKPPKIVSTARFSNNRNRLDYRPMVALPFTAKKFLRCCLAMNAYWDSPVPLGNSEALKLVMDIISVMSYKQIDVLEFLMNDCGFFWLFLHSLTPRHSHLIIDLKTIDSVITESNLPLGFFHRSGPKQIPPYPPNKWGLKFSPADFVRWMVAAEAEISQFDFNESEGLKSFDVLHKQVHRISGLGIEYAYFTSGYEPAEGTPGAVIYCYLEKADEAAFPCEWFNAEVASNGKPEPFLSALYSTDTVESTAAGTRRRVESDDQRRGHYIRRRTRQSRRCWYPS